jgi:hypothetical protein
VTHAIQTYRETPYKIEKLFDIWCHESWLMTAFYFLNEKLIFVTISLKVGFEHVLEIVNVFEMNFRCQKDMSHIIWRIMNAMFHVKCLIKTSDVHNLHNIGLPQTDYVKIKPF